jgi:predicted nuclease of predicted toxin-antitoxin system
VKFYLDEDLSPRIAELLHQRGLDAVSASEVGNRQLSDREQLLHAARQGRALVTRNIRHFVQLSKEAIARQEPHGGIILCPPRLRGFEVRTIADALTRIAKRFPKGLGGYDVLLL